MWRSALFLLKHILFSVQRIEAKTDALLRRHLNPEAPVQPMSYRGQVDPLSNKPIRWKPELLEDGSQVMVRLSDDQPQATELPLPQLPQKEI